MKHLAASLFLIFLLFSCSDSSDSCKACTEQFEMIPLKVIDKDGNPVALDRYDVQYNGKNITPQYAASEYEMAKKAGMYAIVNDHMQAEFEGKSARVVFTGYIGENVVISESFLITADECHVQYTDDKPLTITMSLICNDCVKCTQEFAIYGLWIKNRAGAPVRLDSFNVTWNDRDITYRSDLSNYDRYGAYHPIVSDNMTQEFNDIEATVIFTGYLGGKTVIKDSYLFTSDGCHVQYIDDKPQTVILE